MRDSGPRAYMQSLLVPNHWARGRSGRPDVLLRTLCGFCRPDECRAGPRRITGGYDDAFSENEGAVRRGGSWAHRASRGAACIQDSAQFGTGGAGIRRTRQAREGWQEVKTGPSLSVRGIQPSSLERGCSIPGGAESSAWGVRGPRGSGGSACALREAYGAYATRVPGNDRCCQPESREADDRLSFAFRGGESGSDQAGTTREAGRNPRLHLGVCATSRRWECPGDGTGAPRWRPVV